MHPVYNQTRLEMLCMCGGETSRTITGVFTAKRGSRSEVGDDDDVEVNANVEYASEICLITG